MPREEGLSNAIPRILSHYSAIQALVSTDLAARLATPLLTEEALEVESLDALGRDYYEQGAGGGQGTATVRGRAGPPTSPACYMDDFEACFAHLRMPRLLIRQHLSNRAGPAPLAAG